jgi:hypothetical protein
MIKTQHIILKRNYDLTDRDSEGSGCGGIAAESRCVRQMFPTVMALLLFVHVGSVGL